MHGSDPFVGRRDELALIRRAADRVQLGKAQFVVIEGFTGSGKSTLLHRAMEPHLDWDERTILLDESFSARSGSGIRHLLGAGSDAPAELEERLARSFDAAQNLQRPYLLSVQNLHLIDEVSADTIWRVLSIVQRGPVLVVLSTQGSVRPEVQRLIRLAQASPRGTYIALEPLSLREVAELLEAHSNLPIAVPVAARVLEETDGYPGLVEQVGRWLRRVPPGTRSIDQALTATVRSADYSGMHRDVITQMSRLEEADRRAVVLLAAAETSLSRGQIESALGAGVNPAALLSTSLLSWEEVTGRYAMPRRSLSRAVLSGTSEEDRARLLLDLAAVLEGEESVRHRAEALRLDPSVGDAGEVIDQLHGHARRAAERHDFHGAFDHLFAAVTMALDDVASLSLLAGLAARTARISAVSSLEPAFQAMPDSTCRTGILALLKLQRSDVDGALLELESRPPDQDHGLPVYAEAVIAVVPRLSSEALRSRGEVLASNLASELSAALSREAGETTEEDETRDRGEILSGCLWGRGDLRGQAALNALWLQTSAQGPGTAEAAIEHVSVQLEQLRGVTGVERFEASLHAVRGTLHRQVGSMSEAYQDLSAAAAQGGTNGYTMYARSQLALLLFSSGYWDEAEQMADRAAGEALAAGENAVSHAAYAVSAVIPAARGEIEKVRARLDVLRQSPFAQTPLVAGTIDWVKACLAASQRDFLGLARHLLSMRDDGITWWAVEPQAVSMLARALHASGWSAMLPALLRSAEGTTGAADLQHQLTTAYLRGFERWAAGAPKEAMDSFLEVLRSYEASGSIRPTQPPGEGSGFRIFRALLGIDIATLVIAHPQELARHRTTALELAVWAASVFQTCGAQAQLNRANQLMESLRPRIFPSKQPSSGAAGPRAARSRAEELGAPPTPAPDAAAGIGARPQDDPLGAWAPVEQPAAPQPVLSPRAEEALRGLSRRERQVCLLVAEGHTNREVAEKLVLSVRTVEYHVANAMGKLQIKSRRELRGIVHDG